MQQDNQVYIDDKKKLKAEKDSENQAMLWFIG